MKPIVTLLICFLVVQSVAQEAHHDTTLKNTVRINLTPMLLTGRLGSIAVGYERILKKRQSFSFNIGHLQLSPFLTDQQGQQVSWASTVRNSGFLASADYRFYFSRNKYAIPDGLYWGPYATYYYFDYGSEVNVFKTDVISGDGRIQSYLNMAMVGVQMGYQFVLWDRFTVDFILIGPAVGFYNAQLHLGGDISVEDEEYMQGVWDALVSIFPGMDQLIGEGALETNGSFRHSGLGFRYVIQIGYRF